MLLPRGESMKLTRLVGDAGVRAPPYLACQMSRVETRTPGVTDIQLPYLFGNGAGGLLLWPLLRVVVEEGEGRVDEQHNDTDFYPGSGHREMKPYILHV